MCGHARVVDWPRIAMSWPAPRHWAPGAAPLEHRDGIAAAAAFGGRASHALKSRALRAMRRWSSIRIARNALRPIPSSRFHMTIEADLAELKQRLQAIEDLRCAEAVLNWDQSTYMPP